MNLYVRASPFLFYNSCFKPAKVFLRNALRNGMFASHPGPVEVYVHLSQPYLRGPASFVRMEGSSNSSFVAHGAGSTHPGTGSSYLLHLYSPPPSQLSPGSPMLKEINILQYSLISHLRKSNLYSLSGFIGSNAFMIPIRWINSALSSVFLWW